MLRVLADLRPMGAVGPVTLDEAARVLADRLAHASRPSRRRAATAASSSPARRSCAAARFDVVFIPALAERMFPQKPREDPLLLDDARAAARRGAARSQAERAELEKLQLRLAVGAAESRLYVSFPTVEIGEGRPRVPSVYALEVWRAMTGRVPSADELQQAAARASRATLAWPAPADRDEAIDALEHDLSTLRALVDEPDAPRARPGALHPAAERVPAALGARAVHARQEVVVALGRHHRGDRADEADPRGHRLGARRYSLSALQKYAVCPYQFLLSAIYRMRPAEDLEPLQRMDPLEQELIRADRVLLERRQRVAARAEALLGEDRPDADRSRR